MATKFQIELALKAVLLELKNQNLELHTIRDDSIILMHQEKLFVKESSLRERAGAEEILFELVKEIAGDDPICNVIKPSIEDF